MIVSQEHDFGFVHIPKCAGSTIRQQLREQDDFKERFYKNFEVDGLGRINGNHIPLARVREYFPEEFAALSKVKSYTIVRDPMDRFVSAIAQWIRSEYDKEPAEQSAEFITGEASKVIDYLNGLDGFPDFAHTIFARQADYVLLDGKPFLTDVIAVEGMPGFFDLMETQHNLSLQRDFVWNQTVTYKNPAMAGPLKRAKDVAQKILPVKSYAVVREMAMRAFTTKGAAVLDDTLRASNDVSAFVEQFYAQDIQIHREAAARAETTPEETLT